jgi:hypothetical protein
MRVGTLALQKDKAFPWRENTSHPASLTLDDPLSRGHLQPGTYRVDNCLYGTNPIE